MIRIIPTTLLLYMLFIQACSDCSGNNVKEIKEIKGKALTFEAISLGVTKTAFQKDAARLVGIDPSEAAKKVPCQDQLEMSVPNLDEKAVKARPQGTHALVNCLAKSNTLNDPALIKEVRGEFVDNRLVRATFRFGQQEHNRILQKFEGRFGKASDVVFSEQTLLDESQKRYLAWKHNHLIWLLSKSEGGTTLLVHQDLKASNLLKESKQTSKRGKPVSLEDIGIGKLDLDAPLPEMKIPDAG